MSSTQKKNPRDKKLWVRIACLAFAVIFALSLVGGIVMQIAAAAR